MKLSSFTQGASALVIAAGINTAEAQDAPTILPFTDVQIADALEGQGNPKEVKINDRGCANIPTLRVDNNDELTTGGTTRVCADGGQITTSVAPTVVFNANVEFVTQAGTGTSFPRFETLPRGVAGMNAKDAQIGSALILSLSN